MAPDAKRAVKLYNLGLIECHNQDSNAAFQLGLLYNQGAPEVPVDSELAVKWWSISAALGSPTAMFNLGVMHLNGSGCDMDPITAVSLFKKAKELDPKLSPPSLSEAQWKECISAAQIQKRVKSRRNVPQHIKDQRREQALTAIRQIAYSSLGLVALGVSFVGVRYWMRNRL